MRLHSWVMKTVGVRALKNNLSEYLRMANDGERLAVTNRGVVVARLVPPDAGAETADEALQRLGPCRRNPSGQAQPAGPLSAAAGPPFRQRGRSLDG